ncbi:YjgN family protein [Pacificibacter sp.]|uniref:YjgN family protein n=1 Tax=Pacificibacter sp. TaxID=1917866 RepID=UPI003219CBD8
MSEDQTFQVQFKGNAQTYFGIWIVNLLLSLVTLGIYSAWAKVRTKKYFAQNTVIDGRRFDYHARGMQIFLGRVVVAIAYIVLQLVVTIAPIVGIVLFVLFFFAVPELINRSVAFNARMTSFSGVRFGFTKSYWRAFLVYLLYPILSVLTLYLTLPLVSRAQHRYYISRHRFGTSQFGFESKIGTFYKAFGLALAWMFGLILVGAIAVGLPSAVVDVYMAEGQGREPALFSLISLGTMFVILLLAVLPAGYIYQAFLRNAVYAGMSVEGGHSFESKVRPLKLIWIAFSNAIVVSLTIGLMHPWARVRMARYMASCTYVTVHGSIDGIVGEEQDKVSAIGDAFTDFEGIDVDFGL